MTLYSTMSRILDFRNLIIIIDNNENEEIGVKAQNIKMLYNI